MDKIGQFGQAYGAGMAGAGFNPLEFIKKPQVILRIVAWIFSIIVFGCISSGAWFTRTAGDDVCLYGDANSACGFGTAVGVLSFLALVILLAVDAYFNNISTLQLRKQVVIGDLALSGAGAFLWFITFCALASKWASELPPDVIGYSKSQPQAAIAFSFFSVFVWGGLTFFAWRRYKEGAASAFAPTYEQDFSAAGAPPYGYPGGGMAGAGAESYQEPPFTASNDAAATAPGGAQYQPY